MKKLNIIFDDTTIFNFSYLTKIIKRYYHLALITPVVTVFFIVYLFLKQNDIYSTSIHFKNKANESDSATGSIAKLLGENTGGLTTSEIIGMAHSGEFYHELAEYIYKNYDYKKLNYNKILAKNKKTSEEFFKNCEGKEKCIIDRIAVIIPAFYKVSEDRFVENQFKLDVKSLSPETSKIILEAFSIVFEQRRLNDIKHFIIQQKEITAELIHKKEEELKANDALALKKKAEELENKIRVTDQKVVSISSFYHLNKMHLSEAESSYVQTQKALKRSSSTEEKLKLQKLRKLQEKISKLQQDITAIELARDSISLDDENILKQLKRELKANKRKLKKLGNVSRSMASFEEFLNQTGDKANVTEFQLGVRKMEFKKLDREYKKLIEEKQKYISQKSELDIKLEQLKPDLEYLKLLESKLVQLNLVVSTLVSDIVFSKRSSGIKKYKRNSLSRITLFSFIIALMIYFVIMITWYLFDNRIYDEKELEKNFDDLEIIGQTPEFD